MPSRSLGGINYVPGPGATIWLPATDFDLATGANLALTTTRFPGWQMDPAATETIRTTFYVPSDWVTATFDLYWVNISAGAGACRFTADMAYPATGGSVNADNPATDTVDMTALGQNLLAVNRFSGWGAIAVSGGRIHHLRIGRTGGHANDTLASDAGILGVLVTRAS